MNIQNFGEVEVTTTREVYCECDVCGATTCVYSSKEDLTYAMEKDGWGRSLDDYLCPRCVTAYAQNKPPESVDLSATRKPVDFSHQQRLNMYADMLCTMTDQEWDQMRRLYPQTVERLRTALAQAEARNNAGR